MRVLNEKLELVEEGDYTLTDIVQKFKDKKVLVEITDPNVVLSPHSTVVLLSEDPKEKKERKKRGKGKKHQAGTDSAGENPEGGEGNVLHTTLAGIDGEEMMGELTPDEKGTSKERKRRRRSDGGPTPERKRPTINLREVLTKKGTNRFRPMNDGTVEDILELTLRSKEEVKSWNSYQELVTIVSNLTYLLDKHSRSLSEKAILHSEPVTDRQNRVMDRIEFFVDDIWKMVEVLPKPENFDAEPKLDTVSTADPSKPEGSTRKKRREEEDEVDILAKKVAVIREKLPKKLSSLAESPPPQPGMEDPDEQREKKHKRKHKKREKKEKKNRKHKGENGEGNEDEDEDEAELDDPDDDEGKMGNHPGMHVQGVYLEQPIQHHQVDPLTQQQLMYQNYQQQQQQQQQLQDPMQGNFYYSVPQAPPPQVHHLGSIEKVQEPN